MSVPDYAISKDEKAAYADFGLKTFRDYCKPFPPVRWPYTSASTFATILRTKEIWSTQIACLNDTTEFRRAVSLLRDSFKPYIDGQHDENTKWLAERIYSNLIDDAERSQFFVICMSKRKDDLSQWRAYGGGEGGVAIGLSPPDLRQTDASNFGYLVPVSYDAEDQQGLVAKIADMALHFFREGLKLRPGADRKAWACAFLTAFKDHIVYLAPILKDPAFFQEEEWRLICTLDLQTRRKSRSSSGRR